jgi:DNA-binding response OmpR family regulator
VTTRPPPLRRILVVDDSATIRTIVKAAIDIHASKGTVLVIEAGSVEEARGILAEGGIALMLLDWSMPRVDGLTLVKELRASGVTMPILMLSAVAGAGQIAEAQRGGVTDYVTKPFQMGELWSRIERHLPK